MKKSLFKCSFTTIIIFAAVLSVTLLYLGFDGAIEKKARASADTNLAAHYTFDDGSAADSAGSNNGVVTGATLASDPKVGSGALQFDGAGNVVNIPSLAALDGATQVSIALWIKPDAGSLGILNKWGAQRLFSFGILGSSYRVNWRYGGAGGGGSTLDHVTPGAVVQTGLWQHVVLIYDNGASSIYVNGQLVGTMTGGSGALNTGSTDPFQIGFSSTNSSAYFKGSIDDLRIYTRALSSSDVAELVSLGGGVPPSSNPPPSNSASSDSSASSNPPVNNSAPTSSRPPSPGNKTYTVKADGSGDFTTIQSCADYVVSGDTCLVSDGTYQERVRVNQSGSEAKITFKASGTATLKGFDLRGSNLRIENFHFAGDIPNYQGVINSSGNQVEIIGNTIINPIVDLSGYGIIIDGSFSTVSGNVISGMTIGTAINLSGESNTAENNTIRDSQDIDIFRVFGHDHVIRGNYVKNITDGPRANHMDVIQSFGQNGTPAYNILFERNFVEDLDQVQLSQIEQGCGLDPNGSNGIGNICSQMPGVNGTITGVTASSLSNSSANWITGKWGANHWKDAVVTITSGPAFAKIYLITGNNDNTLTVSGMSGNSTNPASDGVKAGDSYEIRMRVGWWTFKNNVFKNVNLGSSASNPYIVWINNTFYNQSVGMNSGGTIDRGWDFYMKVANNVFLNSKSGNLLYAINVDQTTTNSTFYAGYNYVGGLAPGYAPKDDSVSRCTAVHYAFQYFCEVRNGDHGINGGDPKFQNPSNALGTDGIPFTLDDGLKPLPGSILCGKGENGTDLGAYSCGSSTVLSSGGNPVSFPNINPQAPVVPVVPPPAAPANTVSSGAAADPASQVNPPAPVTPVSGAPASAPPSTPRSGGETTSFPSSSLPGSSLTVPLSRDLTVGSKGEDVRSLQVFLNTHGFTIASTGPGSPGNEIDLFGALTRGALIRYQQANGITPAVGYMGAITRGAINTSAPSLPPPVVQQASSAPASFTRDLSLGSIGEDVRALQVFLNTHGFTIASTGPGSPGNETALFGGLTQSALIRYQQANGITPAVGYFGVKTRGVLGQN